MSYITREDAVNAISRMKLFYDELNILYARHGIALESNSGRRNVVLSQAQEEFFASEISKHYSGVEVDGKTGKPDIVLGQLGIELECKLTSPNKDGAVTMQADELSVSDVPKDFLYVVTKGMKDFAVFHFIGLVRSDFSKTPGIRAKGKVRLLKNKAHKKCYCLIGGMANKRDNMIEEIKKSIKNVSKKAVKKEKALQERLKFWNASENSYTICYEHM